VPHPQQTAVPKLALSFAEGSSSPSRLTSKQPHFRARIEFYSDFDFELELAVIPSFGFVFAMVICQY